MSSPLLLIGIGNRDRGDDAVGPLLAERLAAHPRLRRAGVAIQAHSGEGASLMELWQGARKVVVIDAMKSGAALGSVRCIDAATEKLPGGLFYYSSHVFSLAEAVELARTLGRLPDRLVIYGIEGRQFAFGAPMSPEVEAALAEVEVAVLQEFAGEQSADA